MKLLRFKRPERISQDDLFSQLFALAERRYPALMQNTDPLAGLTVEELDAQLSEATAAYRAAMVDFYAAKPGAVLTGEDAALVAELEKILGEIVRIEGGATEVGAPAAQTPAPETAPDQPEDFEQKKEDTPAQEPIPEPIAESTVEAATVNIRSLPGYGPMTDHEAERELRRYRAQEEGEAWRRNPLSWWRDH